MGHSGVRTSKCFSTPSAPEKPTATLLQTMRKSYGKYILWKPYGKLTSTVS